MDCPLIVCLGSRESFLSDWCRQEVSLAVENRKHYVPVLKEPTDLADAPAWFRSARGLELLVAVGEAEFRRELRRLREAVPTSLLSGVAWAFALLLAGPLVVAGGVRILGSQADRDTRKLQSRIESMNRTLRPAQAVGTPTSPVESVMDVSSGVCRYLRPETGELIAQDSFADGYLRQRDYYDGGRLLASDEFVYLRTPNGSFSLSKVRRILASDDRRITIEDRFDSTGTLISKSVSKEPGGGRREYDEVGRSVYPILIPPYR